MTLDEIISGNVRRLREHVGYSVAQLAERLHVGRHAIYDYERPRPDRGPHAFTWSELVALCAVLECSIFELVLPAEGEKLDLPTWVVHGGLRAIRPEIILDVEGADLLDGADPAGVDIDAGELAAVAVMPAGREELSQIVFHLPARALAPVIAGQLAEQYEEWLEGFREKEKQAAREAHQIMVEALRSALADLSRVEGEETEGDEWLNEQKGEEG